MEVLKTHRKSYYFNNRDKILIKIKCEVCGIEYTKSCKSNHIKSKIHKMCCEIKNKYESISKL